jgi:hypothetical protein
MSLLDEREDPVNARSKRRREELRVAEEARERFGPKRQSPASEQFGPGNARSKRQREAIQERSDALGREPATRDELRAVTEALAEITRWQSTATGNNGITITGNIFTGPDIPAPPAPSLTQDVLVFNPTNSISASSVTEISEPVFWPDATACTVDIGAQNADIGFLGYRVLGGLLFLRWRSFSIYSYAHELSGDDVTVTAFLPN